MDSSQAKRSELFVCLELCCVATSRVHEIACSPGESSVVSEMKPAGENAVDGVCSKQQGVKLMTLLGI